MKLMGLLLAACLSACAWADAAAEKGKLPQVVLNGLNSYKTDGAQAAINAWLVGCPLERNRRLQANVGSLHEFEEEFGRYKDFQVVRSIRISDTSRMVYIQLDYATGPAFGKMLVFGPKDTNGTVIRMSFSVIPEELWTFAPVGAADEK